jgi:hypothetical protein
MKNEFFSKILKKPLLLIIVLSLWPLLTYIVPPSVVPYLQFFYLIQLFLVFNYLRLFIRFLRFSKFPNYEEAESYFYDLKRVKKLELKAKKLSVKKAKEERRLEEKREAEEKRKKDEEAKLEALRKMKIELEERKKKVL